MIKKFLKFIITIPYILWELTLGAETDTIMILCFIAFAWLLWQLMFVWLPGM
jgi:hypothetical protein